MKRQILLIAHAEDETDDAASAWAGERGFAGQWRFPHLGDDLPPITDNTAGVIVYGGKYDVEPKSRYPFLRDEARLIEAAFAADVPVLGICLGAQLMADVLGVRVGPPDEPRAEYGYYRLEPIGEEGRALFGDDFRVLESHWHGWYENPRGATALARSDLFPCQAFRYGRSFAFQFHPETSTTTLQRWIARRGERNFLPGAHAPERQLADHDACAPTVRRWLYGFLDDWSGIAGKEVAAQ